jgi:hypothetical protein
MNDEDGVVCVKQIDDLKESTSVPWTHDQQLFVANLLRKMGTGLLNNHLGFRGIHPMFREVVSVPVDPAELHRALRTRRFRAPLLHCALRVQAFSAGPTSVRNFYAVAIFKFTGGIQAGLAATAL